MPCFMPNLNWKLLTKKRESSTQGLPPGKEALAWVTNTVTLIYGQRDAVLFRYVSVRAAIKGTGGLGRRKREESHRHLCHPCPRRPLLRSEALARQVPQNQ